jgi:hypothetical protein
MHGQYNVKFDGKIYALGGLQ